MESTRPVAPNSTVGQLRKQYGASFAEGHEDTDPINSVLGRAGTSTLGEYLQLHRQGRTTKSKQKSHFFRTSRHHLLGSEVRAHIRVV